MHAINAKLTLKAAKDIAGTLGKPSKIIVY